MKQVKILLLLGFVIANLISMAQYKLHNIFEPFTAKAWQGHYFGYEDSIYLHQISWEFHLDSMAIIETKEVPELNFKMKTFYFFDPETQELKFLSLLNKQMYCQGNVELIDGKIILEGSNHFNGGQSKFKKTFELKPNGKIEDYFYRYRNERWEQGHCIQYE